MPLTKISIKNFRCFTDVEIDLSPGINFFYGPNGSGKTSILESIFIFSSGKSFKSSNLSSLISHSNEKFFAKGFDGIRGYIVEIKKNRTSPISVLLNNKKITLENATYSTCDEPHKHYYIQSKKNRYYYRQDKKDGERT